MQLNVDHKTELDFQGHETFGTPKRVKYIEVAQSFDGNQKLAPPEFEN